jgi:4-hydroxyphenylpyruvate dioxygenase-like putative hemolysin
MAGLFDNPMGADGFEFIEDTAPDVAGLRAVFESIEFDQIRRGVLEG